MFLKVGGANTDIKPRIINNTIDIICNKINN